MMGYFEGERGSLKSLFIIFGVLYILSFNVFVAPFGLIYVIYGFTLEKFLPSKQRLVLGTVWAVLISSIIWVIFKFSSAGLTVKDVLGFAANLAFSSSLIRNTKKVSRGELSQENKKIIDSDNDRSTIRNMIILVATVIMLGFAAVSYINNVTIDVIYP